MSRAPLRIFLIGVALAAVLFGAWRPGRRLRGVFTYGFEIMSFQPCGSSERWWVEEGSQTILHFRGESPSPPPGQHVVTLCVELRGRVSAPGHFGHLGAYARKLTVTKVLSVSDTIPGSCR